MRHSRWTLAIPSLALTLLFGGQAAAASPAAGGAAPAEVCGASGLGWPEKGDAEGATFVGRVTDRFVSNEGVRGYRFKVLKVQAGNIGPSVRVLLHCVDTRFKVGLRYLVSGGGFHPADGSRIERIRFDYSKDGVAWRVNDSDTIALKGYGPGTQWQEVPAYLSRPDTLREAIRAVTPS